jgi:hypothetical protein
VARRAGRCARAKGEALEGLDQQLRASASAAGAIEQQIGSNDYVQAAQGVRALMFLAEAEIDVPRLLEDA